MSEDMSEGGLRPSSSLSSSPVKSNWVQFEEDQDSPKKSSSSGVSSARGSVNSIATRRLSRDPDEADSPTAVGLNNASLDVSEIQVVDEQTLRRKSSSQQQNNPVNLHPSPPSASQTLERMPSQNPSAGDLSMDNVNLNEEQLQASGLRQVPRGKQFENGDVIVTLLPVNERFPWVTPAKFRPELVPEELMAPMLTLTVEDYVNTLEKLTTDMRFIIFNILYKRILVVWIALAFVILLGLIFSGYTGAELFGCGVLWLIMNASAIFVCLWIKLKLNKKLEKCMSYINAGLVKHKIILGVDDRGKLSCHKVNLCFIYFDASDCIKKLEQILEEKPPENQAESNGSAGFDREAYLKDVEQFEDVEIVVAGRNSVRVDRKQERAEKLYLHYVQRWAKDYLRRRLDWMVEDVYGNSEYAANTNPRHLRSALCPCQYIEEHLKNKRVRESLNPCVVTANPCHWCD